MLEEIRKSWIVQNLANGISLFRLLAIFSVLFILEIRTEIKLLLYVAFEATDMLDGIIARWSGNTAGMGRVIDPAVDKTTKFMILAFFLKERLLERSIVGLIALGELFVFIIAGYGIYLSVKNQLKKRREKRTREMLSASREEILGSWKVNIPGKIAMIFYFLMAFLVFLNIESGFFTAKVITKENFELGYKLCFAGGFFSRIVSIVYYLKDAVEWSERAG